jgi:pimeloyl-ACP methyl ester carboxylesterase
MVALIEELTLAKRDSSSSLLDQLQLPEWAQFDLDKVTVSGHSFGGITSLRTAYEDKRVKAALTIDPWMFVHNEETMQGTFKIDVPHLAVISFDYHRLSGYDINRYISKFF